VLIIADLQKPMHICTKQLGLVQFCKKTVQISADLQQHSEDYKNTVQTGAVLQQHHAD
jgi:hypothetical protein